MQTRFKCSAVSTTAAVLGAAAFVVGASLDISDIGEAIRQVGALALVGVIVKTCIKPALKPQSESFAAGLQQGLDQGYTAGHRAARPVVVPIRFLADLANPPTPPAPGHSATNPDGHTAAS